MQDLAGAVLQSMLHLRPEDVHRAQDHASGTQRSNEPGTTDGGTLTAPRSPADQVSAAEAQRRDTEAAAWNEAVKAVFSSAATQQELLRVSEFGVSCHFLAVVCSKVCSPLLSGALCFSCERSQQRQSAQAMYA